MVVDSYKGVVTGEVQYYIVHPLVNPATLYLVENPTNSYIIILLF